MDIKAMYEMIEKLTECAKCEFDNGIENIDTEEMGAVADIIKDLSCAMYHRVLTNSMLEADTDEIMDMFDRYGEDRRYYDHYRYKNGRFAPKGHGTYRRGYEEPPYYHMTPADYKEHSPEYWRDVDKKDGRLYFTETAETTRTEEPVKSESKFDKQKRMFTETKELHKGGTAEDKQLTLKEGEKMLNVIFDEIDEMLQDASPEMRNMVKTKAMTRIQKIQ